MTDLLGMSKVYDVSCRRLKICYNYRQCHTCVHLLTQYFSPSIYRQWAIFDDGRLKMGTHLSHFAKKGDNNTLGVGCGSWREGEETSENFIQGSIYCILELFKQSLASWLHEFGNNFASVIPLTLQWLKMSHIAAYFHLYELTHWHRALIKSSQLASLYYQVVYNIKAPFVHLL